MPILEIIRSEHGLMGLHPNDCIIYLSIICLHLFKKTSNEQNEINIKITHFCKIFIFCIICVVHLIGGGKMGNLFYGESGKQIGKFPIFPHFFKNFIYFYRIFLRSIGCIFIDQYFRVEVKEQDIR